MNIPREDDVINPVNDLKEKADQLKVSVTMKDEDNDCYDSSHSQRGVCLILENDEFHQSLEISNRGGSGVDSSKMIDCFKILGFEASFRIFEMS